jgi:acetyltransferase-like isoleucine patch superfamily enzyme
MAAQSGIGSYNWITGVAKSMNSAYFRRRDKRRSDLILRTGAWITTWHFVDCTDVVELGEFACVAGMRSQVVTHGADIVRAELACAPISIGAYTMVATGAIVLKGVVIADRCVVGPGSVVRNTFDEPYSLIAGNPAVFVRKLPENSKLFHRTQASMT